MNAGVGGNHESSRAGAEVHAARHFADFDRIPEIWKRRLAMAPTLATLPNIGADSPFRTVFLNWKTAPSLAALPNGLALFDR
jgi:hypothetical protein